MNIVFEQPVVNVVELATGPKGDKGDKGDTGDAGPPNTLTAGTVTQIPAGGQPTVSITGTSPNQTLNLGLVDGTPTAFELRGEGFPGTGSNATATNAADVGTYYTDVLGTNGAWRWLKTSAGTGNARWVVALGGTGARNVNAELLNGWVSYNGAQLTLSRENSTVTLRVTNRGLDGEAATGTTFIILPQGFRWARRAGEMQTAPGIARRWIPTNAPTVIQAWYSSSTSSLELATGSGARYDFEISFKTLDPWPSTLPGTPA